ncbi:LysR family transcriptional regulator [Arthrobacter sp. Soil763]|uniref:LysR family transcriptional regulator n=1 Tax=Arthrobacter sp. Soil763 TaxID=1736402 RepID=UPI0006FF732D|nr:LysR family transcriptional regulator [Arthrobacter sp. Soil763]KRE79751.1 LysR family transcriptional regulator [Arthrobacter sp. Soil763]
MEIEQKQLSQLLPLLPLLAELGRARHVTATAEALGVPQSTVSRAIARASSIIGTDLLLRDGRGIRLTPAALALLPHIETALGDFQAGLDLVRHEAEVVRGRIAVSFQHTFGEAMLPLLISAFRSRHPQPAFVLSQGARDGCLAELAAGDADLALTAPVATPSRLISSAALYREPLRLVVHHAHPLAGRRTVRLAEIRQEPFVAMGPGYGMRSLTDALFREAGFRPRIAFESQDSHTARGLVSAGLGVSILPPSGTITGRHTPEQSAGLGCVELALASDLAYREIGLAWRERRGGADAEPDPVRLFRELVLSEGPALLAGFVRGRSGA